MACMAHTRTTESQKPVPRVDGMTSLLGSLGTSASLAVKTAATRSSRVEHRR